MQLWVVLGLTLVAALHAMLGTAWVPVSDPDVWWVAAAGRQTLREHAVPTQNLFSFTDPTQPWIMHEWALGPPYALGLERLGPQFFVLVAMLTLSTGLWLILRATLGRARLPYAGALMACTATLFFLRRLQTARPTCVSLLFPLALTTLAFANSFSRARLAACVLCEWLWANCHGSFPLGILLLSAAALAHAEDRPRRVIAVIAATAVTIINPYGVALHRFVWGYFTGQHGIYREIHTAIPEFGSLWSSWGFVTTLPEVLGFCVVAAMALAACRQRAQRVRGVVCVALLIMAARQARHLELAGLVSCVLLVPWADSWVASWMTQPAADRASIRYLPLILLPTCTLGLITFAVAHLQRAPEDWISEDLQYVHALAKVPDAAHLYIPFYGAGVAIWRGYPRGIRVFYDSRNDCYSVNTLRNFAQLGRASTSGKTANTILDHFESDAVLVPSQHPLNKHLTHAANWRRIEATPAVLFIRERPGT